MSCLTVKVYNGKNFNLPFGLILNDYVLQKIADCSDSCNKSYLFNNIKKVSSYLNTVPNIYPNSNNNTNNSNDNSSNYIKNPLVYTTIEFDKAVSLVEPCAGFIRNPIFNNVSAFDVSQISINNAVQSNNQHEYNCNYLVLVIQVFIKIPNILIPRFYLNSKLNSKSPSQDILLGYSRIPLDLSSYNSKIRLLNHYWLKFGYVCITVDYRPVIKNSLLSLPSSSSSNNSSSLALSIDKFDLLKVIGKGSFGKVMQVRKKDTQRIYALKSIRKSLIISRMEVIHTLAERTVLAKVKNPFITSLKFSFQSNEKLYLVLDFINGGELFYHLQKEGKFDLKRSKFYISELFSALNALHEFNIIYRDLKPENILLDYQGHISLCDFGLCKLNLASDDKTNTFCGTPEYLAPELLLNKGYTRSVDWWTLGILLYEMLVGLPPFYDEKIPIMYKKILNDNLLFPSDIDELARDLIQRLLIRSPEKRLGSGVNGVEDIKNHRFFHDIDWDQLNGKKYTPPFKPPVNNAFDTSNFDDEFTNEMPTDSVVNDYLSKSVQKQFEGWTYVADSKLT
ncbi:kinase-like protein [Ascoidea rubescens DSM 1968]|uniref:non-specific serine/threonine protein kinase n=1 Tax=Ascoidea rubescens DSM 1968 TaxID=1344418 RepID=A0A1D2VQ52_9ASCO|nr:kinase-like protein [Ascoidea rubescens DSM 1968]ODV63685.1 kinase-like protein [Ascoidea rubescens DSM 1968]